MTDEARDGGDRTENQIGVLGSPNTLDVFKMDVLGGYMPEPLYGKLLKFNHEEAKEGTTVNLKVMCQVASMENRNIWHEQIGMRSLIKIKGRLENLSGDADLKNCVLTYLGSYHEAAEKEGWEADNIGTPPRSGEPVKFVSQEDIDRATYLLGSDRWYMGMVPETNLRVPFSIKHFGPYNEGGAGEARMFGIFGQSGSGKSIIAAELIAGFARHPDMGILIIDPQGEFHDNRLAKDTPFRFDFDELIALTMKTVHKKTISQIQIEDDSELFVKLLRLRNVLQGLGYKGEEKQNELVDYLTSRLQEKIERRDWSLARLSFNELCDLAFEGVRRIYTEGWRDQIENKVNMARTRRDLQEKFNACRGFFEPQSPNGDPKERLATLLERFLEGELAIISLNVGTAEMSTEGKSLIVSEIVAGLIREAATRYREERRINGLIVLDEAHRYAAQRMESEELPKISQDLRRLLENATRETRKYSLGWLFITQSIVGFSKEIYRQLTDVWYGFGLTIGADAENVKSRVGEEAYQMYAHFPNPKQTAKYLFLAYGGSVALGTMGKPVVIESISKFEDFLSFNGLLKPPPGPTG